MDLRIGFCEVVVTPPIGTGMAGYAARASVSQGIHDDLHTRAVALQWDSSAVILTSVDVLGIDSKLRKDIVEKISGWIDIPAGNVVIASTHTHSGPCLQGIFSEVDQAYLGFLKSSVAGAAKAALENALPVESLLCSRGRCGEVVVNRRKPFDGPVDPSVNLLKLISEKSSVALINFTCHPVVMGHNNLQISADYPGALTRYYSDISGSRSLFLNGSSANINPLTPNTDIRKVYDRSVGTFEEVDWMGSILAFEALKSERLGKRERIREVSYKSKKVYLSLQKIPGIDEARGRLEEVEERLGGRKDVESMFEIYYARASYLAAKRLKNLGSLEVRISSLLINDTALVFLPSEVFVEHQLFIKENSPFKNTIVVGYADDYFGYIPTAEAFDEGGYEVTFPTTILRRGEGEKLASEAVKLLESL